MQIDLNAPDGLTIEAVRQLRGEAHPAVQVPDLEWAVASGTGFRLSNNHYSSTIVLERFA